MEESKSEVVLDSSLSRSLAKHTAEESRELRTDKAYIRSRNTYIPPERLSNMSLHRKVFFTPDP